MDRPPSPALPPERAEAIVAEAARGYFRDCRARVDGFIDENFSLAGSARLHRHAVGLDLLRAPANVALAVPQLALRLSAGAARAMGRPRTAAALDRNLLLETAVARELRWRMTTGLLCRPFRDGQRVARTDGLAEAILAHPEVRTLLGAAGAATAANRDDPEFRARLDRALADYAGTRAAAAEITTGLIALGTGAVAFHQATPGAVALGPALAGAMAQGSAVASFPLGSAAGGLWYGFFPAKASPVLVAGATAGVLGVAALATAFAGMIADPLQRALGLHHRRLLAFVNGLERSFANGEDTGFVTCDAYVARLMDLGDLLIGISRAFRSG